MLTIQKSDIKDNYGREQAEINLSERPIAYRGFNDNLLSLRGIAAMMVLIFHSMLIFQAGGMDIRWENPVQFINASQFIDKLIVFAFNGCAAVTFFFVHSGFVLGLSLSRTKAHVGVPRKFIALMAYYIKRAFRLFPMIFCCCLLGFYYQKYFFHPISETVVSQWFRSFFSTPIHNAELWRNMLLCGVVFNVNPFLWSLKLELLASILLPLYYWCSRRIFTTYLAFFVFYLIAQLNPSDCALRGTFLFSFFIGVLIGTMTEDIKQISLWKNKLLPSLPQIESSSLVSLSYWRYQAIKTLNNPNFYALLSAIVLVAVRPYISNLGVALLIESLASAVIIYSVYYVNDGPLQRFCSHPFIMHVGKISYSLYLLSFLTIHIVGTGLYHLLPLSFIVRHGLYANFIAVFLTAGLAILLAGQTFAFIERPFMQLGRWLADRIYTYIEKPGFLMRAGDN